jgi:Mg-dependent DNase
MIDVHCHFDMAENPIKYISDNEKMKIITIGMTNLPSHFKLGIQHVYEYKYIRLALGLHPLRASDHKMEYPTFKQYVDKTSYIGEVGLDFSPEGFSTKEIQIKSFEFVLECIQGKKKIISLHSRRAEREVLEMILNHHVDAAIFHWYSGSMGVLNKIISSGFFLSINTAMLGSENGRKIIARIPPELILTETDYPFIEKPDIKLVFDYLSKLWAITDTEVEAIIYNNFIRLLSKIKPVTNAPS